MIEIFAMWILALIFVGAHLLSLFSVQRRAHRDGKDFKAMLENPRVDCDDSDPLIEGTKHCIPNVIFGLIGSGVVWSAEYPMPIAHFIFIVSFIFAVVVIWRYRQIYKSYGISKVT